MDVSDILGNQHGHTGADADECPICVQFEIDKMNTIKTVEQFVVSLGVTSAEAAVLMTSIGRYVSMKGRPENIKQLAGGLIKQLGDTTQVLLIARKLDEESDQP